MTEITGMSPIGAAKKAFAGDFGLALGYYGAEAGRFYTYLPSRVLEGVEYWLPIPAPPAKESA